MTVKWIEGKGYSPEILCQIFEESKGRIKNGKASFTGGFLHFPYNVAVLSSMLSFDSNIPELEKRRIVNKALFNVGGKAKITPQTLLQEMDRLGRNYLGIVPKKFVLITSLSISNLIKLKRQVINNCVITFSNDISHVFHKEIGKIKEGATNFIDGEFPKNYLFVKISVEAKSYSEAFDRAINAIDIFRGIWNYFYNRKSYRMSFGQRKPVNRIVPGPLHTLHFPNGKLVTEKWWYETDYRGPLEAFDPSKEIINLYKFQENMKKKLKKSPFRAFLEAAIVRYTRALDLKDWDNAFLRLWSILETITCTGMNDTHKITVNRASFLYEDREYAKQILIHLKEYRNRAIHEESGNQDIETFMYQIKNFVEATLEFLIINKFKLNNLNEVKQFMNLENNETMLKKRIKLINSALKFMGNQ
ncbi:MAG: hypothetical protein PHU44_02030 [Syntrophales bacterium]|nr:hypothetical protein [Syntrophales bacterium]MDD5641731.1 hypothetical protein [Syntrophales bacterium]